LFSQEPNPFGQPQKPAVASPSNNPFAPPATDSFAAPTNDPFAAPSSDAFNARVGDAFAAASSKNPFAEPSSNDPFAAPKNDPFAAPSARDPFAAASGKTPNPESAPAFDPFTQNQASGAASDLPAQALKAQNRATRRTSVRAQLLASILFPILLVGIGIVIFLAYQLNIIYREQLRIQAVQATAIIAAAQTSAYRKIPDPEALKTLNEASQNYFKLIPEAELIFVESGNSKLSNMTQLSTQTRNPIDPVSMKEIARNMDGFSQGTGSGFFSVAGTDYVGAITQLYAADGSPLGDIHVAFSTSRIASNELNAIVPLLIALGLITLLAIVAATTLSSRLVRPITAAADQANRISLGDLDRVVDIQSNDEIGDLLGSLERMRVSLKSVIGRLRRDR
jgi:methyl-accepting chemotaxis protein